MDIETLRERQAWTLDQKIDHSIGVIEQFISKLNGNAYVAFSGGKDSTVLLHLCRMVKPDIPAVFCNTGNEYPDIIKFVNKIKHTEGFNIEIIHPKLSPKKVFEKHGFPLISKAISANIGKAKRNPDGKIYKNYVENKNSLFSVGKKWEYLLKEPYNLSERCCYVLKKNPSRAYQKRTGRFPILGVMASESLLRQTEYLKQGNCNSFAENGKGKTKSMPLAIWLEDDIWEYINKYNIEISEIYSKGADRTGCMFCGYGCQFQKDNRLQLCYKLYPKLYHMFMKYTNNGVEYREALRKLMKVTHRQLPDEENKAELF